MATSGTVLTVEGLKTYFQTKGGLLKAVDDVSFRAEAGRTLCIVGESGSGKSVTALSIMRLIEPPGRIEAGRILFGDRDLLSLSESDLETKIRGNRIGMVFQDPVTSLNPVFKIGDQIAESLMLHKKLTAQQARSQTIDLLKLVGMPGPADRYNSYPHELSGGMCQRVVIAAAIACEPDLLIADEPTTALDVTIQAQILRLLSNLKRRLNSSLILITHDLGVVAAMADQVLVMYAGRVVEQADVSTAFHEPKHPYTVALLRSIMRLEDARDRPLIAIPGTPAIPLNAISGCPFRPRCQNAIERCSLERPPLLQSSSGHSVACHIAEGRTA